MAIISGIDSQQGLEIDATSKASRVTLYDSEGNECQKPPSGSYLLPINIRHTAATTANSVVWAVRNGTTKILAIRRISVAMGFDGTAAAATCRYGIQRFTTATPTGGSVLTAIKKRTTYSASTIADARTVDTGLTLGAMAFEADMMSWGLPVSLTGGSVVRDYVFEQAGERFDSLELAANEGICIRLNQAAVIGLSLTGFMSWDER